MTTTPLDNFKRALGAAAKAIAREPEMEVSYGGDAAALSHGSNGGPNDIMPPNMRPVSYTHLTLPTILLV